MIRHIVFYCLRGDCDKAAAIEAIRSALEPLAEEIPGLRTMRIRATAHGEFDYVLYSEFESEQALAEYQVHPAHLSVKPLVHSYIARRVSADCGE